MENSPHNLLSFDNSVFCTFAFWSGVLVVKMLLMSLLTAFNRFRYKVFPNPEDIPFKNVNVEFNDPHVERVRRAHRNDMENILPYLAVGVLYIAANPAATLAKYLFRVASVARVVHTLVYAFYPIPQPTRAIVFFVTFFITIYMALFVLWNTLRYI